MVFEGFTFVKDRVKNFTEGSSPSFNDLFGRLVLISTKHMKVRDRLREKWLPELTLDKFSHTSSSQSGKLQIRRANHLDC